MPSLTQCGYFQPSQAGREWKDKCSICDRWQRRARPPHLPQGEEAWGARHAGHSCKASQDRTPADKRCIPITQLPPQLLLGFNAAAILEASELFEELKIGTKTSAVVHCRPPEVCNNMRPNRETAVHHVTSPSPVLSAAGRKPTHTLAARLSQIEAGVFHGGGARQSQGPLVCRGEGVGK